MLIFIVFSNIFPHYPPENLYQFILSSIINRCKNIFDRKKILEL